ncbi:MAG: aquaporin, partial [Rhizobiales bacterium]|nr:aquaporin [Hyphomicrobiales bacterium]
MNVGATILISDFFGTAVLVFLGCGSVAIGGFGAALPMGALPIALAFGLTVTGLAYAIGPISGCHINPAATLGLYLAGRFPAASVLPYIAAQLLGGVCGAGLLLLVLAGKLQGYDAASAGLGQNGWGENYLGGYNWGAA